ETRGQSRRTFLKTSTAAAVSAAAAPIVAENVRGANERIRIGLVGLGGRMHSHVAALAELAEPMNIEIAAICDCDQQKLAEAEKHYPQLAGKKLLRYSEQRKLFEDKSIHAVSFSTQDHWHALQTIWACQAGKDVYIEKPPSHNIWEGRKMVEAARKYGRIVQVGTQCRSSPNIIEGIRKLREGIIGDVYMARGMTYKIRGHLGKHKPTQPPPGLDWDAWVGPAEMVEYSPFMHRRWYWISNFASGDTANQTVHDIDIIRWGLGLETAPTKVQSMGGRFPPAADDDADTPNTQTFSCQWEGKDLLVTFEIRHWYTPSEAGFRDQYPFVDHSNVVGVIFFGTKGYMIIPDYSSYRTFFGPKCEPGPYAHTPGEPMMDKEHFANWIQAMRSRKPEDLTADILTGHLSCSICHLAKIAYKLGRTIQFDPKTEQFPGDEEANRLLKRKYRPPYIVPEQV
ncbi:MAG TPA: Gfo/Idh/MocA family oxidoreductase, partial [Thermoguttaceae bacterium]|nr:Gfo/Idh/MocA family oxidoreductase [Thermoguttaceae bacterium]